MGALGGRLFQLQITDGHALAALAENNRVRRIVLVADRGIIYDRHGVQLTINRPAWSVEVIPADLPPRGAERTTELRWLAKAAGASEAAVAGTVAAAPDTADPVVVAAGIDDSAAQVITERLPALPGVRVESRPLRTYVDAPLWSHILGYTGPVFAEDMQRLRGLGYQPDERIGRAGIEAGLESVLRGTDGWADVEVDAAGRQIRVLHKQDPIPGRSVYLSVDAGLQAMVAQQLQAQLTHDHNEFGAAVVVNPQDGHILALVSLPGYDINAFSKGISTADYQALLKAPGNPLFDQAIAGQYPPGSTFKMITAAAGLQTGAIDSNSVLGCPSGLAYGGWYYRNWASYDLGPMDVTRALALSCDTFFYQVAPRVGDLTLARFARAFGYGAVPGIELPGAAPGVAPDRNWKLANCTAPAGDPACNWNPGETLTMAIGQSYVLTTPLIQAMYVSTVANGGDLLRPTLVAQVRSADGHTVQTSGRTVVGQVPITPANMETVRQGMRACLDNPRGTGFYWRLDHFSHDGGCKTGTAQYGGSGTDLPTRAWVTFFSPYDSPEVAIVVMAQNGWGEYSAEPVAVKISDYYFSHRDQIRSLAAP